MVDLSVCIFITCLVFIWVVCYLIRILMSVFMRDSWLTYPTVVSVIV